MRCASLEGLLTSVVLAPGGNIFIDVERGPAGGHYISYFHRDASYDQITEFTALAAGVPNDGVQSIIVPATNSDAARVQVRCADNIFFDVSNADFDVVGDAAFNAADINRDGCVDRTDLILVLYALISRVWSPLFDADADGSIGIGDLIEVASRYTNPYGGSCRL